jgi:hypothetical protein
MCLATDDINPHERASDVPLFAPCPGPRALTVAARTGDLRIRGAFPGGT